MSRVGKLDAKRHLNAEVRLPSSFVCISRVAFVLGTFLYSLYCRWLKHFAEMCHKRFQHIFPPLFSKKYISSVCLIGPPLSTAFQPKRLENNKKVHTIVRQLLIVLFSLSKYGSCTYTYILSFVYPNFIAIKPIVLFQPV